jgi:asparagine synthase (glutamine-hydrolysing)
MCGFAGVIAFDEKYAADRATLARMSAAVAHRGPDGEGMWIDDRPGRPHVALAHRRLAILDPDPRSNQPFTDGRRWLVYNGEIYNFRELRRELYSYQWKTTGDTEVLLAAYDKWGEECVNHLNGMFAFAVWDSVQETLFLARDPMGQKPLYFAEVNGAIAFASEIGALLPLRWIDRSIVSGAIVEYLRWGYIPSPLTIYRGIWEVLPRMSYLVSASGPQPKPYHPIDPSIEHGADGARRLIEQAVRRQLVSDVPLGCFLSGGMDSSVIAAAMCGAVGKEQEVHTFSIGFDDPRYDETKYATAVAKDLGTEHHTFTVHPDAAADLPKIAAAFGQPMADSSALPTYYLSMQTRQHVKVALSGDGGDELFGGYDRYRALHLVQATGPLPWKLLRPLIGLLPGSHPKSSAARAKRLAATALLPEAQRYAAYLRLMDDSAIHSLMNSPMESPNADPIEESFNRLRKNHGAVEAAAFVDRMTYLPGDVLTKVDRCSMLHALEVRSPFLDPDVVSFASGLTEDQLLGGGPKRMLREAFAADLPAWVFRRKKMGFAVPIGQWLRTSLRPILHDLLFATDSFAAAHFNRPVIEKMIDDHQERRLDHSQRLYALLMLELWHRSVNNSVSA